MSVIDFSLNPRSGQVVNNTISWKTGHDVKNKQLRHLRDAVSMHFQTLIMNTNIEKMGDD